ncbi:MAG: MBL fold metallo-hydrolase [Gemmatimonadetes bacterium]|uniref:MBL fold metallo-hydrolase n=1 Tax=Candidatus Kutchimonas denitrificans TaxID=3056748 RepID=A0AAE4Z634_9BACT|nr:MBL fold metallo-hydrolase [Gemmatimonadota bacterium]NIR74258.1 MBL fold metallo-hydrolase [Candidatus Kutchimonas denitrificans]NIS02513.1 MBL fold metallo-hydrolase [Gemmatimonadota bacterium]NIT68389.1 MBL fold metallo-hydrolase [Gemmatimonadota bacterium]NIU51841.1 MBL fold metallo-hydrolase [Gemmatimonadota bacterium]
MRAFILRGGRLGAVLLGFAVIAGCTVEPEPGSRAAHEPAAGRTRVVLLGTGTPNAEPDRSGSAVAVVVDDTPYLVDLGPGVVRRATAARRAGIEALAPSNLRIAFVTHLHTDHTLGYPDFIFTPWVLERDEPAEVYGPPGIRAMTDHLLAAYGQDVRVRIDGLEPANPVGYQVNVHEIEPGLIYEDERVRVTAFPVDHGGWTHAFGYRFDTPDRSVVISGDTRPSSAVVEACGGCDVLIHEVYSQAGFDRRSPVWQRYHAAFHTSTVELAELATRARPGLLVLYHQLLWGSTPEELLEEVREGYDGAVVYGDDLDVF